LDAPSEGAVTQKVEGVLDDRTSSGLSEGGGTELANSESKGTKSVKAEIPETQDKVEDKNIENRKLETNQPEDKQPDEDKKAESTRPAAETLKAKNPDDKTGEGETPTAKEPGSNETEVKMPAIESLKHARTRDVTLKKPSKTTLPLQKKIPPYPAVLFGEVRSKCPFIHENM
jgi:hypothetical protein